MKEPTVRWTESEPVGKCGGRRNPQSADTFLTLIKLQGSNVAACPANVVTIQLPGKRSRSDVPVGREKIAGKEISRGGDDR